MKKTVKVYWGTLEPTRKYINFPTYNVKNPEQLSSRQL